VVPSGGAIHGLFPLTADAPPQMTVRGTIL